MQLFESRRMTNILLGVIILLLAVHLLVHIPVIPRADAQLIKTTETDYLQSMDKHLEDIKNNSITIRNDIRLIQQCVVSTPVGGKALSIKNAGF